MTSRAAKYLDNAQKVFFAVGVVFCALALASGGIYRAIKALNPSPRIVCDVPILDLGEAPPNSKIPCEFVIRNTGNKPLMVSDVRTGCGKCIQVVDFSRSLLPGDAGKVRIQVNTESSGSAQVKGVTILSNDPVNSMFVLRVSSKF